MKSVKICFLILVFFLISLSCVNAQSDSEIDSNLTVENAEIEIEMDEEVYTASPQSEEVLSATDNSFYGLYQEINSESGILNLNKDYIYSSSNLWDKYILTNGITISKSITINGNGHSIDANFSNRIFSIIASNVVLNNITFKKAYAIYDAAINWQNGGGINSNCKFEYGVSFNGGAIYSDGSSLTLINNTFKKNQAVSFGSVIYQNSGKLSIYNCSFINSSSTNGGGAIYCLNSDNTISNSIFEDGYAYNGAGIFTLNTTVTLNNTSFKNNYAEFTGGAVYQMYGNLSVNNCFFLNNSATDGGAICIDAYKLFKIANSNFTLNSAYRYGGAVVTLFNSEISNTNSKLSL